MFEPHDFTFTDDDRSIRRNWRAQRLAWSITALALVAIACGALGDGFLSKRTASSSDEAFQLDYAAVVHNESDSELTLRATGNSTTTNSSAPQSGITSLQFGDDFARRVTIVRTVPDHTSASSAAGETVYRWNPGDPPNVVVLKIQFEQSGLLRGKLTVNSSHMIDFKQFSLP